MRDLEELMRVLGQVADVSYTPEEGDVVAPLFM
jgi:hypothetical protein